MSLHDIFLQRAALKHQNEINSDNAGLVLPALAQGVARGIEQEQKASQKRRQVEAQNKRAIDTYGKIITSQDKVNGRLIPSLKMKSDGTFEVTAKSPTISEGKILSEQMSIESYKEGVRQGLSSTELARQFAGNKDIISEIQELEELGVLSPQTIEQPQGVGIIDSGVNIISDSGEVIKQEGDSVVTERTPVGRPDKVISKSGKTKEAQIKTVGEVQEEQTKAAIKSISSFNRVKSASMGLVSAAKRIVKEQGGLGVAQILQGKVKRFIAKTGLVDESPEEAQAGMAEYRGQVREMVLALSPILTDQNRVIQGVIDMLSETLWNPNEPTTGTEFTAQLKQTTKNAYRLSKALVSGMLTNEDIEDLQNNKSNEEIQRKMKEILAKSSWTKEDENAFNEQWNEIRSVPASIPENILPLDLGNDSLQIKSIKRE